MRQLYVVTVETELVVLADSPEQAEKFAETARVDEEAECTARVMTHLPWGWEGDSLPYGHREDSDPDRTIDDWIRLGAAPLYQRLRGSQTPSDTSGTGSEG